MNPKQLTAVTKSLSAASISLLGLLRRLRHCYYRVAVVGDSMSPALHPGDYLLLRRGPASGVQAAGSLVAIRDATGRPLLKRVVGLPGESIRVGTDIQINGVPLVERYAWGKTAEHQFRGVNRLGEDEYFLVGDNRTASTDSRDFGSIHRGRIDGIALFRYWPPERFGSLHKPERQFGEPPAEDTPTAIPSNLKTGG